MGDDSQIRNRALLGPTHKDEERAEIQVKTEAFLKSGGVVEVLPGWDEGRRLKDLSDNEVERIRAISETDPARKKLEVNRFNNKGLGPGVF